MYDISFLDVPVEEPSFDTPSTSLTAVCVCCNCDRVRLRSGEWRDDYSPMATEHHTYGLCPSCFSIVYPECMNTPVVRRSLVG